MYTGRVRWREQERRREREKEQRQSEDDEQPDKSERTRTRREGKKVTVACRRVLDVADPRGSWPLVRIVPGDEERPRSSRQEAQGEIEQQRA